MSQKIEIITTVLADKVKVWNAYTAPEHIVKWNFASPEWCCPSAQNDLQVGGHYKARMEAKDGSFGFDFEGVYEAVKVHDSFVYQLADGRKVSLEFNKLEAATEVKLTFDPENQNSLDRQRNGWQAILHNFKHYVESN